MSNSKYEEQFVTFIDILGFADKVVKSSNSELPEIKSMVDQFRNSFNEDSKGGPYEDKDVSCISFSDSIMRTRKVGFAPLFYELLSLVHNIAQTVNNGHLVRGGMTFGNHFFDEDDQSLISPAFIKAYKLESREALFPRVIIDPSVFEEFKSRNEWYKDGHSYKQEAEHVYKIVRLDSDGYYFVDYLKAINSELDHPPHEYPRYLAKHKELIITGFNDKSLSIKKKYIWLANYHNKVLSEFGDGADTEWDGWKEGLEIDPGHLNL